jgi:hypothetical protein
MQDLLDDFTNWYNTRTQETIGHVVKEKIKNFMDILFIRLRAGDESGGVDNRLGGWLGVALKSNMNPEPIKKYKPKNAKLINQKNVLTNENIKTWSCVSDVAFYLKKSRTVTSSLIKRHEQISIDNLTYVFEYATH